MSNPHQLLIDLCNSLINDRQNLATAQTNWIVALQANIQSFQQQISDTQTQITSANNLIAQYNQDISNIHDIISLL